MGLLDFIFPPAAVVGTVVESVVRDETTRISALRQVHGASFAPGVDGRMTLDEAIGSLDGESLRILAETKQSSPK